MNMRNMQKINSILTKIKDFVAFRVAKKWICTNLLLANTLSQKYRSKYGAKMVTATFAYHKNSECMITM